MWFAFAGEPIPSFIGPVKSVVQPLRAEHKSVPGFLLTLLLISLGFMLGSLTDKPQEVSKPFHRGIWKLVFSNEMSLIQGGPVGRSGPWLRRINDDIRHKCNDQ
jgi:hypothetical protein